MNSTSTNLATAATTAAAACPRLGEPVISPPHPGGRGGGGGDLDRSGLDVLMAVQEHGDQKRGQPATEGHQCREGGKWTLSSRIR